MITAAKVKDGDLSPWSLSATNVGLLGGPTLYLAHLWWFYDANNNPIGTFTDHDRTIDYFGIKYYPARWGDVDPPGSESSPAEVAPGMSAIQREAGLRITDAEMAGVLSSPGISEEQVIAGVWDDAWCELYVVDWRFPWAGPLDQTRLFVMDVSWDGGYLKDPGGSGGGVVLQLGGFAGLLSRKAGPLYEPECGVDLGSAQCGVDIEALKVSATVASATRETVTVSGPFTDPPHFENWAAFGFIRIGAGSVMEGQEYTVRSSTAASGGQIDLVLSDMLPVKLDASTPVEVYPGCNKLPSDCGPDRYDNIKNNRGFPSIPGADRMLRTPDAN